MADEIEDLEKELQALLEKYKKLSAIIIIREDEKDGILFAGNMCPVCASNDLVLAIISQGLTHYESKDGKVH